MSEQTNPTPDMETAAPPPDVAVVEEVKKTVSIAPPPPPVLDVIGAVEDMEEAEEEEEGVPGPEEYVERERGGRSRRVGSDVRLEDIDYKNVAMLSRFLDRRGRILSRRKTRVSAKMQRRIVREVKRARHMALVPYTADQTRIVRRRK